MLFVLLQMLVLLVVVTNILTRPTLLLICLPYLVPDVTALVEVANHYSHNHKVEGSNPSNRGDKIEKLPSGLVLKLASW
jgi:hypothetical protein